MCYHVQGWDTTNFVEYFVFFKELAVFLFKNSLLLETKDVQAFILGGVKILEGGRSYTLAREIRQNLYLSPPKFFFWCEF